MRTILVLSIAGMIILGSNELIAQDSPPMGLSEVQSISVFMDAYSNDEYDMAIQFGEWMLIAKPKTIEGYDRFSLLRHFDRMISVYTGKASSESDPSISSEFFEKAVNVFELAFETFDEDEMDLYDWHLKYGRYLHEYSSELNIRTREIAKTYEKAFEADPNRFTNEGNGFFLEFILNSYASAGERDSAFSIIERVEEIASEELLVRINEIRESLFESPQERINYYSSIINDADDHEREKLYRLLVDLYQETGNSDFALDTALKLYQLNPTLENTSRLSDIYLADGNYETAAEYLKEAFHMADNESVRKEVALELASVYQQLQKLREAREFVREALRIDQNYGSAYMQLASIYAGTVSQCTGGSALERDDRTVYWLVIDYLEKAKTFDPSLTNRAESQLNLYRSAMPTVNDKFFRGWEAGDSFRINASIGECYAWIDESTIIK